MRKPWEEQEQINIRIPSDVAEWLRIQQARDRARKGTLVEAALRLYWEARQTMGTAIMGQAPECVRTAGHRGRAEPNCEKCRERTWG